MAAPSDDVPLFSIGAVSRMLDVAPATIRNWEDRYGAVRPVRSGGGHRLYSRTDVERLGFVRDAVEDGASPADAHRLLAERLGNGEALHEPEADAPGVLILVAEPNEHAADLIDFLLRTEGFAVEVAASATDALQVVADHSPALDVVLLLVGGGEGLELCRELKRQGAPAVLATSELRIEADALAAGADAFLGRPLDSLALLSAVRDLLGRSAIVPSRRAVGA
jgi:CheY-like chemotaxis protein